MMAVTAYKDMAGRLHEKGENAAESDLAWLITRAWEMLPADESKGAPGTLARFLARSPGARKKLREALEAFEAAIAALTTGNSTPATTGRPT